MQLLESQQLLITLLPLHLPLLLQVLTAGKAQLIEQLNLSFGNAFLLVPLSLLAHPTV